jgi:hypothetical protein
MMADTQQPTASRHALPPRSKRSRNPRTHKALMFTSTIRLADAAGGAGVARDEKDKAPVARKGVSEKAAAVFNTSTVRQDPEGRHGGSPGEAARCDDAQAGIVLAGNW